MVLPKGRARLLQKPDYTLKLAESVVTNSEFKEDRANSELKRELDDMITDLTSDELYQLDAEVRAHIDPALEKYFPGQVKRYNLVFLNSNRRAAYVIHDKTGKGVPTIFVDRMILDRIESMEELIGLIFHEMGHVLRAKFSDDMFFDRLLKQMPEEALVDAFATRMLFETGRNPLGYSILMERLLTIGAERKSNLGITSHPPTKSRLTHVNAIIERASERKTFPPLTPLTPLLRKIKALPEQRSNALGDMRIDAALAENFSGAIREFSGFGLSGLPKEKFEAEFQTMLNRLTVNTASAWGVGSNWKDEAAAYHGTWVNVFNRSDEKKIKLAFELEKKFAKKAAELGIPFFSEDTAEQQRFSALQKVDSLDQVLAWVQPIKLPAKLSSSDFEAFGRSFGYSTYQNPQTFQKTFEHYIQLAPTLYSESLHLIDQLEKNPGDQTSKVKLEGLRKFRLVMTAYLYGWTDIMVTRSPFKKLEDRSRNYQFDEEGYKDLRSKAFVNFDSLISKLKIPDYAKLAFFPSIYVYDGFTWSWDHYRDGAKENFPSGIFPSAINYLAQPELEGAAFKRFHRGAKYIESLTGDYLNFDFRDDSGSSKQFPVHFESQKNWLLRMVPRLKISGADAFTMLESDYYWESAGKPTKEAIKSRLKNVANDAIWLTEKFIEHVNWGQRRRINKDIDETVESLYGKDNFYNRPEYQLDPKYAETMQVSIFENLQKANQLPANLPGEVKLWSRFAKRGVTTFTDEWAERIIQKFEQKPQLSAEESGALREMYTSNLVWSLKARERLALKVYTPENSALIRNIVNFKPGYFAFADKWLGNSRENRIRDLVTAVTREFPENSQERLQVVDRLAERIRANPSETSMMMKMIDHEERDLKDLSISRKQALGIRFYAQLFGEVQNAPIATRLELFDFILGRTDYIPDLLRPRERWDRDSDEEKKEPLLFQVRRNIKPYRIRSAFQALSVEARTMILDPFFIGNDGLIEDPKGRKWIIDSLVPRDASWRNMAVDLVEGYREALHQFGQGHLKTMVISYLVAASAKPPRRTDYGHLFKDEVPESAEDESTGKLLKSLFSANAALQKIGQRLHSANVLYANINRWLESLKESASRVLREDQFAWVENAGDCPDVCELVQIQEELGNASIKIVLNAKVRGKDSILYMIKPNAYHRGETFFRMINYAVDYAIKKGHTDLRLMTGMIRRAGETFARETDLNVEREAAQKLSSSYRLGKTYGTGYQFTTPEFIDTHGLLKSNLAAAVKKMKVRRFFELDKAAQNEFAQAVSEKESEVHQMTSGAPTSERIVFDKDRHEGNYLLVTDEEVLKELGITNGKLILVIDFAQTSEIRKATQNALMNAVAVIASLQTGMMKEDSAARRLTKIANQVLFTSQSPQITIENLTAIISKARSQSAGLKPGEMLSRVLSYVESEGHVVHDEVWDYLTALSTMQTWEKYDGGGAFANNVKTNVMGRCAALMMGAE